MNEQGFVLEGWVLYAAIVVPVLAGMLVCYGRSVFARLLIVAAAIIIVSVGIGSVYAALYGHPWEYVPLRIGQYIDFFGGSAGGWGEGLRPEPQDSQWAALSGRCWGKVNLFFRQPGTPLRVVLQEMPQRHKQLRSMSHSPLVQGLVNVVDDHGSYDFAAVRLFGEATCQSRGGDFRDVLMLRNRGNFFLVKATEADAVLQ
jgi:hypothetical protein